MVLWRERPTTSEHLACISYTSRPPSSPIVVVYGHTSSAAECRSHTRRHPPLTCMDHGVICIHSLLFQLQILKKTEFWIIFGDLVDLFNLFFWLTE